MINKTDLRIVKNADHFYIQLRTKFLFFFYRWDYVTWLEGTTETPIRFKTFIEAVKFINSFAD
jgi:hypothetical protein